MSGTSKQQSRFSVSRRRLAALAVGASLGLAGMAAPASAHVDHSSVFTFGSIAGCAGEANRFAERYTDLWFGHQMQTKASLVADNRCLRVETVTWSDHWTNGFRGYASISLKDRWGYTVGAWETQRYWVENVFGKMHARTDYQTFSLAQWQVDSVMNGGSIQIVHNRN